MKRVLLTGATGFVGRHCLSALVARNYEVHAVSFNRGSLDSTPAGVRWHQADLLNAEQVRLLIARIEPTHLLHCAWYAVPGKYWDAPENFDWAKASLHLLKAFANAGGKRAVGVGTCAEYDWSQEYCSEISTPLNPATPYGACKLELERGLSELGQQKRISTAWGRLFFLYGPHEDTKRLVPSVIISLLQEEPALCSHGEQVRDFLYVQDAGDALAALVDSEVLGAVNIASGVPVRLREVVEEIAEQLHRPQLIKMGAKPAAENEPACLVADVVRLRDEVRWTPRYNLRDGLAETISWWRTKLAKQRTA
jgi:nucleoside-diphosphate-sugar epimerase